MAFQIKFIHPIRRPFSLTFFLKLIKKEQAKLISILIKKKKFVDKLFDRFAYIEILNQTIDN